MGFTGLPVYHINGTFVEEQKHIGQVSFASFTPLETSKKPGASSLASPSGVGVHSQQLEKILVCLKIGDRPG